MHETHPVSMGTPRPDEPRPPSRTARYRFLRSGRPAKQCSVLVEQNPTRMENHTARVLLHAVRKKGALASMAVVCPRCAAYRDNAAPPHKKTSPLLQVSFAGVCFWPPPACA